MERAPVLVRHAETLHQLPPGFRFKPTDQELVVQYLRRMAFGVPLPAAVIPVVRDLYGLDPWDIPGKHTRLTQHLVHGCVSSTNAQMCSWRTKVNRIVHSEVPVFQIVFRLRHETAGGASKKNGRVARALLATVTASPQHHITSNNIKLRFFFRRK
jgi:hypothetical protein